MTLSQPWWLLLGLLVGLLFYLHRQRRAARAALVGGLHLWKRVAVQHTPQTNPLPRLTPALLLQLLVLLLVALALARPTFRAARATGGTLVLLESSRAMQVSDLPPSRFQSALAQASREWRGPVTVVEVGDFPWPLAVERADVGAVRSTLRNLTPTDGAADWEAAGRYARGLLAARRGVQIVAYTSAGTFKAAEAALRDLNARIHPLGSSQPNAAITGLTVQPAVKDAPWTVRGSVRGYGGPEDRTLSVSLAGTPLTTLPLRLKDGQDTPFTLKFTPGTGGVLQVTLNRADPLPADDQAQLLLTPTPRPLRITLVGTSTQPNPDDPLERGLSLLPGAQLTRLTSLSARPDDTDLLVITRQDVTPAQTPFAPVTLWLNARPEGQKPDTPLAWNDASRLSGGLTWADLRLNASDGQAGWTGSTPLLSGQHGPLIEVRRTGPASEVRVHFPLKNSNWPDLPAFPVFLRNLATLAEPRAGQQVSACTVGLPCLLPARAAPLGGPGLKVAAPGESFIPRRAGTYEVDGEPLAVNRFASTEADLRINPSGQGGQPPGASSLLTLWPDRLWRLLLGAALLALLLELLLHYRSEPGLRRGRWATFTQGVRRMLALHALAALLMLLAVFNLPLPGREQGSWTARLLPAGLPDPTGRVNFTLWSGADLTTQRPQRPTPPGDLALALATVAAAAPADAAGTVTVSGAGWPVSALWPDVQAQLRADGLQVKFENTPPAQPALPGLSVPAKVSAGETFAAQASLYVPRAGSATLSLRRGDTQVLSQTVNLRAGFNRLALPLRETQAGVAGYTLTLVSAGHVVTAQAATRVQGDGGVLLVSSDAAAAGAVQRALQVQGVPSRQVKPGTLNAAALSTDGLRGVERIALLNVPARALTPDARAALDELVRGGAHLFLGGGSAAFGPGGYVGTALETLSPLSGRVTRDVPRLGLALVVDKSGSMNEEVGQGFTKLDLIKTAALNSALLLSPQSDVTVIAFDSAPKLAVPLTQANPGNRELLRQQISRIEAEGGTVVKRALDAALKELGRSTAAQRHIILLTDGIDGGIFSPDEYERLIRRIHATGITVSTVSVGSGMHIPLMRNIAGWGGGRFSLTQDWRDVPALLAQDTLDQGQTAVKTGRFSATWGDRAATLNGYVQTTLKPGATRQAQVSAGHSSDPLAASWRVGLGSVSALATQTAGSWAGSLATQPDYPALLTPLLRGETPPAQDQNLGVERSGADLRVTSSQPQVQLRGPTSRTLNLIPDGGGHYQAQVYAPTPGGYSVSAGDTQTATGITTPLTVQPAATQQPDLMPKRTWHWQGGWATFALLSLLSFLLGLALRYLPERPATSQQPPSTASP